jgi:aminopeptidase N
MWLNEGWANYSEYLFAENVYGREKYLMLIKENHKNVLQYAHSNNRDGEPLPVSGIGHEHTYGMHVYQKGGDMVHTLRGIMGDDAFFRACADFQDSFKFQSVNTEDMMNFFNNYSRFDLAHFSSSGYKRRDFVISTCFQH